MGSVSLTVTALVVGGSAGVIDPAKDVVSRACGTLKSALVERRGDDPAAGKTLERRASNPEGYDVAMRHVVTKSGAADDAVILQLAHKLLSTVGVSGGVVGGVGDGATVTQTFGRRPTA